MTLALAPLPAAGDRIDDLFGPAEAPAPPPVPEIPSAAQIARMLDWQAARVPSTRGRAPARSFAGLNEASAGHAMGLTVARLAEVLWKRARAFEGAAAARDGCRACGAPAPGRLMGWWGEAGVAHCGDWACIETLTWARFDAAARELVRDAA
jgi:hypothetical protein